MALSPNKNQRKIALWLGILILVGIMIGYILGAFNIYRTNTAFPHFPIDRSWMMIFAAGLAAAGVLVWLRQGRVLIIALLSGAMVLLVVAGTLGQAGYALLTLLWLIIASAAFGNTIIRLLVPVDTLSLDENLLFSTGAGFALTSIMVAVAGHLGWLYSSLAWGWLSFMSLVGIPLFWRNNASRMLQWGADIRRAFQGDQRIPAFLLAGLAVCMVGAFLWTLAPTDNPDALNYHIGVPEIYLRAHAIIPVPETHNSYISQFSEMLYTFALALVGQPLTSMIHFVFSLMGAGMAFSFARRFGGRRAGLVAALLYYSAPFIGFQAGMPKNEIFLAYYVPAVLLLILTWWDTHDRRWLLLAGFFAGMAVGSKYSALVALLPAFLFTLIFSIRRHRAIIPVILDVLSLSTLLLLVIPWLIRDYLWTGNPFYPVQYFDHLFILHSNLEWPLYLARNAQPFGAPLTLLLRLNGNCGMLCKEMPGAAMGVLPLAFLPLVFPWHSDFRSHRKLLLNISLIALLSIYLSFYVLRSARYFIPLYALLAGLAALNLEAAYRFLMNCRGRFSLVLLAGALLSAYLLSTRLIVTDTEWTSSDRYPYSILLGMKTPQQFLSESLPVYEVLQFLDRQSESPVKVLSLGSESRVYTTARIYGPIFASEARRILLSAKNEADLAQQLKDNAYQYILVYPAGQRKDPEFYTSPYLSPTFYADYTRLVFAANTVRVYRFYPEGAPVGETPVNLLKNPGFEAVWNGKLQDWTMIDHPTIDLSGKNSRSGSGAVQVEGPSVSTLSQDVTVQAGALYTVGYWTRADDSKQVVQVFIDWLDAKQNLVRREADWQPIASDWSLHTLSSTAPQGAEFVRVYVSISSSGKAWFDDLCFVQAQACPQ